MNLTEWLQNPKRTYADGVELLKVLRHSKLAFFQQVKDPKPDDYHFRLLISVLQNEARKRGQKPAEKQEIPLIKVTTLPAKPGKTSPPKTEDPPKTDPGNEEPGNTSFRIADLDLIDIRELPEDLAKDYKEIKGIMPEIGKLHTALKSAKTDDSRKDIAEAITALEEKRTSLWAGINEWYNKKTEEDKAKAAEPLTDEAEKARIAAEAAEKAIARSKRIDTLKINISRAQKEIDSQKLTAAKVKSREEKIVLWQQELDDLLK
jgi:hypothetical protein